ncbi:MAG TPA: cytochrome c oxidase assembly protein [Terriglobales bacterium]|nr:cytochrome c oxidase assembly protein [Terriglobales bacterium]
MPPVSQAVLLSWSVPPAASFALAVTAVVYLRGWVRLRRAGVPFVPLWRAVCFLLGLLTLWVALASPCDTFSAFVLTAHMLQHMLLMMVAPPLILLGAPLVPLVRGLPAFAAREFAGPFLNWRVAKQVGNALIHPAVALLLLGGALFAWHTPRLYELALASGSWHEVEHACFFAASLIFWWPVIQPWPSRPRGPRWGMVPYLLAADVENTVMSAILVFSDRLLYPSYAAMPRLFGFSAVHDQAAAGALMWVMGSMAFTIPAMLIAVECLQGKRGRRQISLPGRRVTWLRVRWPIAFTRRFPPGRWNSQPREALSFLLLFAVTGLYLAHLAAAPSDDDDQALRFRGQSGAFAVSVFAPSGDLETGASDFSVLVQDANSQGVLRDATVDLYAQEVAGPQRTGPVRATSEDAENKLLQSASLNLPAEGEWKVSIVVRRGAQRADFSLPVRVVRPEGGKSLPWPYLVLLGFSVVLWLTYYSRNRAARTPGFAQALPGKSTAHVP